MPVTLFATGVAAALPALLLFTTPVRDLLALLVNDSEPSSDTSWGFIASHYPGALVELLRANVGFLRRGEWYTALFLVGGVLALLLLVWRRRETRNTTTTLMTAGGGARARLRARGARSSAPSGWSSSSCRWPRGASRSRRSAWRPASASATVRSRAGSPGLVEPRRMDRPV